MTLDEGRWYNSGQLLTLASLASTRLDAFLPMVLERALAATTSAGARAGRGPRCQTFAAACAPERRQ
jgi:hypothetical protein